MPTETITLVVDTIDDAADQILDLLEHADNQREVIYFHGWFGFGASAVLKAVVKKLRSSSGLADTRTARDLRKIIHVDCSQWQSKRALQKVIAEELELPPQVMALIDQHDEEDDFDGVEQSDRAVIPYVKAAIMNELMSRRFLVVFHNGSGSYIDLWEAGVPVMGQLSRMVLWTSRGRFWHHANDGHGESFVLNDVESANWSDAAMSLIPSPFFESDQLAENQFMRLMTHALYAEAKEVAKYTGVPEPDMSPKIVIECLLYMALSDYDHNINCKSHASSYWVCDGIIKDGTNVGRSAWEISDALQRNMSLDFCSRCTEIICEVWSNEQKRFINRWVSVTNPKMKAQLSSKATSFFWTGDGLEALLFEHSNKAISLRVIHLSHCVFSFSSPPFLSCSNLRFLLLDHCKDKDDAQDGGEKNNSSHHGQRSQKDSGAWFQSLWVLELSYTDWYWLLSKDMLDLMVNLRELNVKGVSNRSISHLHRCSGDGSNSRNNLLKLRVVAESYKDDGHGSAGGDRIQQVSPMVASFPDLSSWHNLKTIILNGCGDLETIGSDALPQSLELFSLTGNETTKIKSISFRGCAQLKSLLLRGLFRSLEELDMSGTAIKTLDLNAAHANGLKRLFLLGCEKLNAILWPQGKKDEFQLEVLRIDTTSTLAAWDREDKSHKQEEAISSDNTSTVVGLSAETLLCGNNRALTSLDWYISLTDPRIFRSLLNLRNVKKLHVEILSASGHKGAKQGANSDSGGSDRQQVRAACNLYHVDDIISTFGTNSQSGGGSSNGDVFEASVMRNMWIWPCPSSPRNDDFAYCYISIQDDEKHHVELLQGTTTRQLPRATTLPGFVNWNAKTLHLHGSLPITSLPGPAPVGDLDWDELKWCRLENCPNLEGTVFSTPSPKEVGDDIFEYLETFWASQLLKARYIWDWRSVSVFRPGEDSFENLVFLHIDYCPRLVHVLPLYTSNTYGCYSLETLEIVCCGNLREVFPSDSKSQQQEEPRKFPRLKRIHLYELSKLQRICGHYRMLAPRLETVKVRGCWGLKRLPAVRAKATVVDLDCEKEWWDNLKWDGKEAGHCPSHYKPTYSAYYKKNQLRASVLR